MFPFQACPHFCFWVFEAILDCVELFPPYTFAINNVVFLALITLSQASVSYPFSFITKSYRLEKDKAF